VLKFLDILEGNHRLLGKLLDSSSRREKLILCQSQLLDSYTRLLGNREVGLVNGGPTYSTTPISMTRRLTPRIIIKRACGNNDLLAAARLVRHGAIAALADLPRKASRFRQIVARD
jgi:hypothetical protein